MTDDILRKLGAELIEPVTTERQVVYILCQVRKIVDRDPNKQRWKSLKLYCDWAMHPDLTYDNRTRPFIQEIETWLLATLSPEGTGADEAQNAAIQRLVYLDGFRDDLHRFLDEQGLPNDLTVNDSRWNRFLAQYGGVIQDGSLVYSGTDLQLVKQMTFTTMPPSSEAVPFDIRWEIQAKSGQRLSLKLHPNWSLAESLLIVPSDQTGTQSNSFQSALPRP